MRLSDIKTIDELREFASHSVFYMVATDYPFGVDVVRSLRFGFDRKGYIEWFNHSSPIPIELVCNLFDNGHEADMLAAKKTIEYLESRLKLARENLEVLEKIEKDNISGEER